MEEQLARQDVRGAPGQSTGDQLWANELNTFLARFDQPSPPPAQTLSLTPAAEQRATPTIVHTSVMPPQSSSHGPTSPPRDTPPTTTEPPYSLLSTHSTQPPCTPLSVTAAQKFSDSAIIGLSSEDDDTEYRGVIQDFVDWCQRNHLLINVRKTKEMNHLLINVRKTKEMNHLLINVRKTKEMNHLLINVRKTKEMNHLLINVRKTKEMNHLLINVRKTKEMNHLLINAGKTKEMNHLLINVRKTKEMNHLLINAGKTKEMNHLLINAGKTKEMNHLLINAGKTKEMNHLLINAGKTKEMKWDMAGRRKGLWPRKLEEDFLERQNEGEHGDSEPSSPSFQPVALLTKFDISSETYRQRFRATGVPAGETPTETYHRLRGLYRRWIRPDILSKDAIGELIVLEQLLCVLPPDVRMWVKEHNLEDGLTAAKLALQYQNAHRGFTRFPSSNEG
uniref:SCAN box domain-containing protein n=1 Tax=Knipowitschia caucasica TaxID=637954 RepID=A0AAV2MMR2_KNICA